MLLLDVLSLDPSPSLYVYLLPLTLRTHLKTTASSPRSSTAVSPRILARLQDAPLHIPRAIHIADKQSPAGVGLALPKLFAVWALVLASLHPLPILQPLHLDMPALGRQLFEPTFFECLLLRRGSLLAVRRTRHLQCEAEPSEQAPGSSLIDGCSGLIFDPRDYFRRGP